MSFETDRVRVRWKAQPDFSGAAAPFGCVYERGVSQPVHRFLVQARVKAFPAVYELLCPECQEAEDPALPAEAQPHKAGCALAPAPAVQVSPAAAAPLQSEPPQAERRFIPPAAEGLGQVAVSPIGAGPAAVQRGKRGPGR